MNLHLSDEHINSLSNLEIENLFIKQTEKYNHLNQTIDGYKFSVISTLSELQKLADKMKNAAFYYRYIIMKGNYLILTINNEKEEDFTNFGIKINQDNLIFDNGVGLKLYLNKNSPQHIQDVFVKFAQKNNININEQQ